MKILIVHHCDSWGGAGVSLYDCCRMLSKVHDVYVCLPHKNGEVAVRLSKLKRIKILSIENDIGMITAYNGGPGMFTRTFVRNILRISKSKKLLTDIIAENKFDLVIANSVTLSWVSEFCKKNGIKNVTYVRETRINNLAYQLNKHLIQKYADGVLFISQYDKECLNLKNRNQCVIRDVANKNNYDINITKEEACSKFNVKPCKLNLLYVGGMEKLKGYDVMIKAMAILNNPQIHLTLAGSVNEELKVDDENITYVGKVYDMPTLYKSCDVLVFPSTKGHQGRPIFEAGFAGKTIIISNFRETFDEVKDGKNGLLFEPCNAEDLAEKILIMYKNSADISVMGKNNYELAVQKHEFENGKDYLLRFLANLK